MSPVVGLPGAVDAMVTLAPPAVNDSAAGPNWTGTHAPACHCSIWFPAAVLTQVSPFFPPYTVPELITELASGVKYTATFPPDGAPSAVTVNGPPSPPELVKVSPTAIGTVWVSVAM